MSTPMALIASGTFTSDGNARTLQFPKAVDYFMIRNRSTWGTNPNAVVQSEYYSSYAAGQATTITESGAGVLSATLVAAGGAGFTAVDESTLAPQALVATGTAITAATPAVVSDATSPAVNDIVQIMNTTGMLQIGGMEFTVTAVTGGVDYTLGYLPAAGFAAAATNADYRIIPAARYSPERRWITAITAANPAVVTLSVTHAYTVGDIVSFRVPTAFGMIQMNNLTGEITAINTATNTITVNIDASGFDAFAFPASAVGAGGLTFAQVLPVGEIATALDQPTENTTLFGLTLGTTVVGANTNDMDWVAYSDDVTI